MGALFSGPTKPPSIPTPPPMATPPTLAAPNVQSAGANAKNRAAGAAALEGENPTGSQGLIDKPSSAKATLLGQ